MATRTRTGAPITCVHSTSSRRTWTRRAVGTIPVDVQVQLHRLNRDVLKLQVGDGLQLQPLLKTRRVAPVVTIAEDGRPSRRRPDKAGRAHRPEADGERLLQRTRTRRTCSACARIFSEREGRRPGTNSWWSTACRHPLRSLQVLPSRPQRPSRHVEIS